MIDESDPIASSCEGPQNSCEVKPISFEVAIKLANSLSRLDKIFNTEIPKEAREALWSHYQARRTLLEYLHQMSRCSDCLGLSEVLAQAICDVPEQHHDELQREYQRFERILEPRARTSKLTRVADDSITCIATVLEDPVLRGLIGVASVRFNETTWEPEVNGERADDIQVTKIRVESGKYLGVVNQKTQQLRPVKWSKHDVVDALLLTARKNSYNPVQDYLSHLTWDGVPRIDSICEDILDAKRTQLNILAIRRWLISAVARAFEPGCKADDVLILQGEQGVGKSQFFSILGGKWFTDVRAALGSREAMRSVGRCWIWELSELSQASKRTADEIKAVLSATTDSYNEKYDTFETIRPRRYVISGTTNTDCMLVDETGNRRSNIIECGDRIRTDLLREQRDQLWAEARIAYESGERWWFTKEEQEQAEEVKKEHIEQDPWHTTVERWLSDDEKKPDPLQTIDILSMAIGKEADKVMSVDGRRIASIMRQLGYKQKRSAYLRWWIRVID